MSLALPVAAMAIPPGALVEKRIPKTLLVQNGTPTAADRRRVQDGIDELTWVAALKPSTVGVQAFSDDVRAYTEIHVLTAALREKARSPRIVELIHRAIPYPVALWIQQAARIDLSLAHKRRSLAESGAFVTEDVYRTMPFDLSAPTEPETAFLDSLAISSQPGANLLELYNGWLDRMTALETATRTGSFAPRPQHPAAEADRLALKELAAIDHELASLRAQAKKERQMSRRVELNLEIKRKEADASTRVQFLGSGGIR